LPVHQRPRRRFQVVKPLQYDDDGWLRLFSGRAATWNCVAFIQTIASKMGLRTPGNHLLYPEDWVNQLRALNGGRKYMPGGSSEPMARAPAAQKPAAAAGRKPATPPLSQVVDANPRT
jgi:hypothetical protein